MTQMMMGMGPEALGAADYAGAPPAATRPRKKRRKDVVKRTRPPTGYNLFVREKLERLKREGKYEQYADSKAAFRAAVDEWKTLTEDQKKVYLQARLPPHLHSVLSAGFVTLLCRPDRWGTSNCHYAVSALCTGGCSVPLEWRLQTGGLGCWRGKYYLQTLGH